MARLHEYQAKAIFKQFGIPIPEGATVTSPDEAFSAANRIGKPVVIKAQAWVTGRAGKDLIHFADNPDEARAAAETLLGIQVDNFAIDTLLVEEQVAIEREFFLSIIIDDQSRAPLIMFSGIGGTGIEEIAQADPTSIVRHAINIRTGLRDFETREFARKAGFQGKLLLQFSSILSRFYDAVRSSEARSAEINPLVLTGTGILMALDARVTIDDSAVFRHPELNIEIAREFDHPPTSLERSAWQVEKNDYRGTFYFVQVESSFAKGDKVIGFHGSGGGGSMLNMDALLARGFRIANFVDTSGNPPASKVYRAARIILSQAGIDGYYAGGSGVASQEQFHTARGLVKAFMDEPLNIPAVIRIGGNAEEKAIEILERANGAFPAPLEAYGRDASPEFCVERLQSLVESYIPPEDIPTRDLFEPVKPYSFETVSGGTITYDHTRCLDCETKICVESCVPQILSLEDDVPVLNIGHDEARQGGCTECLACEVECHFLGNRGGRITLPIIGLDE